MSARSHGLPRAGSPSQRQSYEPILLFLPFSSLRLREGFHLRKPVAVQGFNSQPWIASQGLAKTDFFPSPYRPTVSARRLRPACPANARGVQELRFRIQSPGLLRRASQRRKPRLREDESPSPWRSRNPGLRFKLWIASPAPSTGAGSQRRRNPLDCFAGPRKGTPSSTFFSPFP